MANEKNLKPFDTLTESEQRAIAKKGGKASGEARRERKEMRELMTAALDGNVKVDGKQVSAKEALAQRLIVDALNGDLHAIKYIIELIGEAPAQRVEVTGKDGKDLYKYERELSRNEARKFIEELGKEYGWSGYE